MEDSLIRLALFTVLPVVLGAAIVRFDRTATGPVRRAEAVVIPLFLVGIGGGGVTAFVAQVFLPGPAALALGWAPGSPFQLEAGFARLAIGLLGAVAAERRDGFREATVAAATVYGVGAALVRFIAIDATGTAALMAVSELATPLLLIWLLVGLRRAEQEPATIVLRSWMVPVRRGAVAAVAVVAGAISIGQATGQVTAFSLAAMAGAAAAFWWVVSRAPSHRAKADGRAGG